MSDFRTGMLVGHARFRWVGTYQRMMRTGPKRGLAECFTANGRPDWREIVYWKSSELR